ncbi:MAG: NAD(P)/FAD-dependent oxidoreductase [Bacteriovoracaceae bacterium]|nr:NAD(P)/FAD-dependent oxidoreductase [Bacteriovoracaceae bacterium]
MAALRAVLNNDETLFFPGSGKDKKKSRGFWVRKVENVPGHLGYKRGIEDPNKESLDWLASGEFKEKFHWKKGRGITSVVKRPTGGFELTDTKGEMYIARFVIIATGVMDIQPHIDESIQPILPYANVQVVDYCIRCDGHHTLGKHVTVIGHTSDSVWVGALLKERYDCPVHILTNGSNPEFDETTKKLIQAWNFKVSTEKIVNVIGKEKEGILEGYELEGGEKIETNFSFISLGMIVYNELAKSLGVEVDDRGFSITDAKGQTNVEGVYAAGDLRAGLKKQIYTAWDSAVDSADHINGILRREKRKKAFEDAGVKI